MENNKENDINKIYENINKINNEIKLIESFKIKFEEKISDLIQQNELYKKEKENNITNSTTISKRRKEEDFLTPKDIKIFTEENINELEDKSNINNSNNNISLDDRVVKKINFTEADKEEKESEIFEDKNNFENINNNLKNELLQKENIIIKLQQEIKNLEQNNQINNTKNETIEHKALVDDEEFNELVEENEELKKLNKELMEKIAEITTKSGMNSDDIANINNKERKINCNEENEELISLRKKLEEVYRQLNEYRLQNSELNNEIKNMKEKNINGNKEIENLMDKLKIIENENSNLKELLKHNQNDLKK